MINNNNKDIKLYEIKKWDTEYDSYTEGYYYSTEDNIKEYVAKYNDLAHDIDNKNGYEAEENMLYTAVNISDMQLNKNDIIIQYECITYIGEFYDRALDVNFYIINKNPINNIVLSFKCDNNGELNYNDLNYATSYSTESIEIAVKNALKWLKDNDYNLDDYDMSDEVKEIINGYNEK